MPDSFALEWDKSGERMFETGVDRGVLYVWDPTLNSGAGGYGNGIVWNGLTQVTEKPEGADPTDIWADNIKYATLRSAEKFGATIEAYMFPDEFYQCDGSASVATGVYIGQQSRKTFGFCYRSKVGDDTDTEASKYKIHVIYNATASPSERSYETINDSPNAITMSWDIDTTPVNVTGHKPTSEIVINAWELDSAKLTTLENTLYGTSGSPGTAATLPDPDTLIGLLT